MITLPLKSGGGKKAFSYNVSELMNSYEENGKIGNAKPGSKKKALQMALAIAYKKKREK